MLTDINPHLVNYEFLACPSKPEELRWACQIAFRYAKLGNQLRANLNASDLPLFTTWDYRFAQSEIIRSHSARSLLIAACDDVVDLCGTIAPCWSHAPILDYCNLIYEVASAADAVLCAELTCALSESLNDTPSPWSEDVAVVEKGNLSGLAELWSKFSKLDLRKGYSKAKESLGELPPYVFSNLLSRICREAALAERIWIADGSPKAETPPLSDTNQMVLNFIRDNPGRIGKEIQAALDIPIGTLTRHCFPTIYSYGLRNKAGYGYYIKGTEDSAEPR